MDPFVLLTNTWIRSSPCKYRTSSNRFLNLLLLNCLFMEEILIVQSFILPMIDYLSLELRYWTMNDVGSSLWLYSTVCCIYLWHRPKHRSSTSTIRVVLRAALTAFMIVQLNCSTNLFSSELCRTICNNFYVHVSENIDHYGQRVFNEVVRYEPAGLGTESGPHLIKESFNDTWCYRSGRQ